MNTNGDIDLLDPGLLHEVRLELTTRCNLKCVYCAVSQATYEGTDMPEALAHRVIPLIADLASSKLGVVHVNGHGETTFLSGWMKICESLLQSGLPISITTNLAREYSVAEAGVLAQMSIIHISIDSSDRDLMKTIRRRVDVNRIVSNVSRIRAAAQILKKPEPTFHFSCGIYDRNAPLMEEFASFSVELGIRGVGFWNMTSWKYDEFPYQNTDVPEADRVYPLDTLSNEELRPRMASILHGIEIMKQGGIAVHANGDFVEVLNRRLDNASDGSVTLRSHTVPGGMTRDCVDPWTYFEMGTNGDIKPCCAHSKIGNLGEQSLSEILNGEAVRQLRADLLEGHLDSDCDSCRLRAATSTEALRARIKVLLEEKEAAVPHPEVASRRVTTWLESAVEHCKRGNRSEGRRLAKDALRVDPGINVAFDSSGRIPPL